MSRKKTFQRYVAIEQCPEFLNQAVHVPCAMSWMLNLGLISLGCTDRFVCTRIWKYLLYWLKVVHLDLHMYITYNSFQSCHVFHMCISDVQHKADLYKQNMSRIFKHVKDQIAATSCHRVDNLVSQMSDQNL